MKLPKEFSNAAKYSECNALYIQYILQIHPCHIVYSLALLLYLSLGDRSQPVVTVSSIIITRKTAISIIKRTECQN